MKAHFPVNARQRQELEKIAREEVKTQIHDISTRCQYQWALAMLQVGLSPKTVRRVMEALPAVAEKYMDYQTEKLGDLFMRTVLGDAGLDMPETDRPI